MLVKDFLSMDKLFSGSPELSPADRLRFALFASRMVDVNGFWFITDILDRPMLTLTKEETITVEAFKLLTASLLDIFKTDDELVTSVLDQSPRSMFELFTFLNTLVDTQLDLNKRADLTLDAEISSIIASLVNPKEPLEKECASHVAKFFNGTIEAFTLVKGGRDDAVIH